MLRKWNVLLLILSVLPATALAQNTGKISGQITDATTGETLPGASVVIVGTTLGTAADLDGNYFIIGVPVGTYTVQAQFVGFQTQTTVGVEINAGYTRELNFELQSGIELEELVIEYERPLIQKDAVGVPKIVDAEAITALPVRGAANVAKIQAGVVSKEGSGTLNIRGGRGAEVTYYVDGVKGGYGVPQGAVQQQEMVIGSINARYGDAMSGIINITTKSGSAQFFGSVEALSSSQFDKFGYNLVSASIGGPIVGDKLSFFAAAEIDLSADRDPRSISTVHLSDAQIQDLWDAPMGLWIETEGTRSLVGLPIGLADGAKLRVNNDGTPDLSDGGLSFSDGTFIQVAEASTVDLDLVSRAEQLTESDFTRSLKKNMRENFNQSYNANVTWDVLSNARIKVGGTYRNFTGDGSATSREIFSPQSASAYDNHRYSAFVTWTQYLSSSTFYQIQASWRGYFNESYDPRFARPTKDDLSVLWSYADIDHPVHASIAAYRNITYVEETRKNPSDDTEVTVRVPTFNRRYEDGLRISSETTAGLVGVIGGGRNGYSKSDGSVYRVAASATTQIGLNQLEFGAEYETSVGRSWGFSAENAARVFADGDPENIDPNDTSVNSAGYTRFEDIPTHLLRTIMGGTGYNILGNQKVDSENFSGYQDNDKNKPEEHYYQAPHKPIYYGAYVQDKIEFRDIVLNLGLRVDVWDNNRRVYKDKYARRPIERAGNLGISLPTGIGTDYAVYFSGSDVVGYRDLDGGFYDADGNPANAGDILLNGLVRRTGSVVTEDMFEDYVPQVTLMPRIGVSFPITDRALFFASYGVVSRRPSTGSAGLGCLTATACNNNNGLLPENTTKYELGFRQRLGARQAFTVSGFFHQINNLIQIRDIRGASPATYSRYENVDFGTVKGVEFDYDLRRTQGVALRANYTLSFAQGTGSGSRTTSFIVWIDETPPNFISPLDFDQRHKINVTLDYSLGKGEGPTLVGTKLLQNFGINLLFTAGSGFPYTGARDPLPVNAARAPVPRGGINEDRLPWTNRLDLRIQRRFSVPSGGSITAFLWMQNVLNTVNVQEVYRYSGLPDDDGFLATAGGAQFIESASPVSETLYRFRNRDLNNFGRPRLTRLGIRFDF
ncbi:MAG: carboxypeptidase-like regulatory domain-containing protein [Bacteroidetes bacterium]|nr:carboxypeptidase-like regulatory domain-containing protein [Bacteroidota bacterium]MCY4204428.1 carboxypeptidase-like regulatory domain-containing protein [Bacteroidota bacterium]